MPETFSSNVAATSNEQPEYNVRWEGYVWNPASNATPALGQIVRFLGTSQGTTPAGDGQYTPIYVDITTTTPDFLTAGVVIGGSSLGSVPVVGGLVMVATEGCVQALFDANNTTVGHLGVLGSTTAGTLTDSATATLGKTVGTILQNVTIGSGTALVWIHAHLL